MNLRTNPNDRFRTTSRTTKAVALSGVMALGWFGANGIIANANVSGATELPASIQAEDFSSQSGLRTIDGRDGGTVTGYTSPGDSASYLISTDSAATYRVDLRVSSAVDGSSIQFVVDGDTVGSVEVPNTGDWFGFQTISTELTIPAGTDQTLTLDYAGSSNSLVDVNWMEFTELDTVVTGLAIPGTIEAENFSSQDGIRLIDGRDGGTVLGYINDGDSSTYDVSVNEAGTKTVELRVASAVGGSSIDLQIGNQIVGSVDVPNTGGWGAYTTVSTSVDLPAGQQTLTLDYAGASRYVLDINWLRFTDVDTPTTTIPPTTAPPTTTPPTTTPPTTTPPTTTPPTTTPPTTTPPTTAPPTTAPPTTTPPTTTQFPPYEPEVFPGPAGGNGANPRSGWSDSYSVGDQCYIDSTFDHDAGELTIQTSQGTLTILEVFELVGPGPGAGDNPVYNDVQCGNGPANNAGDEDWEVCPGRVDLGPDGCSIIGPTWNIESFLN